LAVVVHRIIQICELLVLVFLHCNSDQDLFLSGGVLVCRSVVCLSIRRVLQSTGITSASFAAEKKKREYRIFNKAAYWFAD
jgi:hypothetical protein